MKKTKKKETSAVGQLLGVAVFLIALVVGFMTLFTIIGPIICFFIGLAALGMGYKQIKVMKCKNCGYNFPI